MSDVLFDHGDETAVLFHILIGIDANGTICSCGEPRPSRASHLEHVGEVALAALDAPPTPEERKRAENRARYQRRLEMAAAADRAGLNRARRVLTELQASHEAKWAQLEATGLTRFVERDDWLRAHRTPDEVRADRLRDEARIERAAALAGVIQFPRLSSTQTREERRTA